MAGVKIWFDGGCRPNPGAIETAVVTGGRSWVRTDHGTGDNSDAEWLALIEALTIARSLGIADAIVIGDSTLVVRQASGQARHIAPRFAAYLTTYRELTTSFTCVRLRHVRRHLNLAGIALERARIEQTLGGLSET